MITDNGASIAVRTSVYRWEWSRDTDLVQLADARGRMIGSYPLQPVVETTTGATTGRLVEATADGNRLTVVYSHLTVAVDFHETWYAHEEIACSAPDIVAVHFPATVAADGVRPAIRADRAFVPGGHQDLEQHIFSPGSVLKGSFSLGSSAPRTTSFHQQPLLPSYLFAFYNEPRAESYRIGPDAARSAAACMGLTDVPAGNPWLDFDHNRMGTRISYRGDIWPDTQGFGCSWVVAIGNTWYDATRAYTRALIEAGRIERRTDVPESAYWPEYDTWGDQVGLHQHGNALNQERLQSMYDAFRASGMDARLFVIDDLWETAPGSLRHCPDRFPDFDGFLAKMRGDGVELGLWTAFPRCGDFRDYGLDETAVLRRPDGTPYFLSNDFYGTDGWYIFDPTHAGAAEHLAARARELVRRYGPKLVKIDFGYEIPMIDIAAPHDVRCAGDKLFAKFLEVIVPAIKEADPGVTVQYYSLTPLLAQYWDHLSLDDMWLSAGHYEDGFAKRALVASLASEMGLPVYGSTGYDWKSTREIWFDTAVLGTIGSLAPFSGDIYGQRATPQIIATYNGIARVSRANGRYDVELLDAELHDTLRGPIARSWARREHDTVTVVALRSGGECAALVRSTAQVVVASLDDGGIGDSNSVGIVPFGSGTVTLRHAGTPTATAHLYGGDSRCVPVQSADGWMTLAISETLGATPVESITVAFT